MPEREAKIRPSRPHLREKLMVFGAERLSDAELLALVLGVGGGGEGVEALAWRLIQEKGGLVGLSRSDVHDLSKVAGVGQAKASRLAGLFAIARRLGRARSLTRPRLGSGRDVYELLAPDLVRMPQERFLVLSLDGRNRLVRLDSISLGTARTAIVHPRDVFAPAINCRAVSVVLAHNHPSGDPAPSREDMELTDRLRAAGELLGLEVLDHVIIGEGSYVSLAEKPGCVRSVD